MWEEKTATEHKNQNHQNLFHAIKGLQSFAEFTEFF